MKLALIPLILLFGCAAPRPNTEKSIACAEKARLVAYSKEVADSTVRVMVQWAVDEARAYDACMGA